MRLSRMSYNCLFPKAILLFLFKKAVLIAFNSRYLGFFHASVVLFTRSIGFFTSLKEVKHCISGKILFFSSSD